MPDETEVPHSVSCVECAASFISEEALTRHRAEKHPQYVQMIFTPDELKIILCLTNLGAAHLLIVSEGIHPFDSARAAFDADKRVRQYIESPQDTRKSALVKLNALAEEYAK